MLKKQRDWGKGQEDKMNTRQALTNNSNNKPVVSLRLPCVLFVFLS